MVAGARLVALFAETTTLGKNDFRTIPRARLEPVVWAAGGYAPAVDRVPRKVERQFQFSQAGEVYRVFRADCKAKRANSRSNTSFRRRPHVLDATRILWLFSRIRAELVGEFSLVIRRR